MQQMKKEGVKPDIHTYTSFINACCKAGDLAVPSFSWDYNKLSFSCVVHIKLCSRGHVEDLRTVWLDVH